VQPFVPDAAAALLDQLAVPADERGFADLQQPLPPGRRLPPPRGIFPRFVETDAAAG
jgi:methionyl-tRNA synthetase